MSGRAIIDEPDEEAWGQAALLLDSVPAVRDAGELQRAEELARRAVRDLTRVVGRDHPDTANAHDTLASVLLAAGRTAEALAAYRNALAILELWSDEEAVHPMRAATLGNLSYVLTQHGLYEEARTRQKEALDLTLSIHGDGGPEAATAWNGMGVALKMQGLYDDARAAYLRAAGIWRALAQPLPATLLHNLAGLETAVGDGVAAEKHARAAVAQRRLEDGDTFELGTDLAGLGDALIVQGRAPEAEAAFREALGLLRTRADHPEVAYALHNLGDALAEQKRFEDAVRAYEESIARKRAVFGDGHHEIAASEANLAAVLVEKGDPAAARKVLASAVKKVKRLPQSHPIRVAIESLAASAR